MKKALPILLLFLTLPLFADSAYQKGVAAYQAEQYDVALKYFYISARRDNVNAYTRLGILHDKGLGTGVNKYTALYWYEKAAKLNHPYAQYQLALLYERGDGVKKDLKKATFWYQKAAKNGNEKAAIRLSGKDPESQTKSTQE